MSLLDNIINAESGGNARAKNPRSSATGAGQFIESTWLNMIAKHRPDLADGRSRGDILALRNDGQLSRDMTGKLASDNSAALRQAGYDPTPGNVYLSHFAGSGGAKSILGASPSAAAGDILGPAVVKANPFLASMTAQDLQKWADGKANGRATSMRGTLSTAGGAQVDDTERSGGSTDQIRGALRQLFGTDNDDEARAGLDALMSELARQAGIEHESILPQQQPQAMPTQQGQPLA